MMSTRHSIPPQRDLPPGHLTRRKKHLIAEISRETESSLGRFVPLRHPRVVALAGASLCAASVAVVLSLTLTRSSDPSVPTFVMQALRSPAWGTEQGGTNWGGLDACSNAGQVFSGCHGLLMLPGSVERHPRAATSPEESSNTEIVGGSASQRQLLRSIVDAIRPSKIEKIIVVPSNGTVELQMQAKDVSMRTLWQQSLVSSAFRDRVRAAGSEIEVSMENGDSSGVIAPGPATPLPSVKKGDVERTRQTFESAAVKSGVKLDELTINQPYGIAVAVTLRTREPAAFLAVRMPTFLTAIGDRWHDYDGVYIRLVDEAGSTLWETSNTARTSTGSVSSREDLLGCSPIASWGSDAPPCPAR